MLLTGPIFALKIAPSREGSRTHSIHGSLGPPESTAQTASRLAEPFLQAHGSDRQTDRQSRLLRL